MSNPPISFEENKGQTDESVRFLSRGRGFDLLLRANETVYSMPNANCERRDKKSKRQNLTPCLTLSLKMKMLGANEAAVIQGVEEIVTKSSYYIGNDPTKWLDDISSYKAVRYRKIYQGIDVIFRGSEQNLEYDFHLSPNADPKLIQLGFEGTKKMKIDRSGNLVFKFRDVELRHQKPFAYQITGGVKQEINVRYVLLDKNRVGFEIGEYDRERELIIDPLVYASYLGGTAGGDSVNDIAVDRNGNVYTASDTRISFPDNSSYSDVMISKFDLSKPPNEQLLWVKYIGGAQDEVPNGMDVNADGDIYVTGITWSPDFPMRFAEQSSHAINVIQRDYMGFVFKLHPSGDFHYSTFLGGGCNGSPVINRANSIVADSSGNAYVTGYTCSPDFPVRNGFQISLQGTENAFLTKYDLFGRISYSTYFGNAYTYGRDIVTDGQGNAYITGLALAGLYTTSGAYSTSGGGFVAKFNTNAAASSSLVYSTYIPSQAYSLAVDASGNAWAGTNGTIYKLNSTGTALLLSHSASSRLYDLAIDQNGSIYYAADANPGIKVVGLRSDGSLIDESAFDTGSGTTRANGVAVGTEPGIVYVGGHTKSTNFPTTPNAYQPNTNVPNYPNSAFGQGFLAKIQLNGLPQRNPLIFIPGIMGSSIRGNWNGINVPFWVNVNPITTSDFPSVYNLTLDVNSFYYTNGLYASDVIRTALGQPVYENLLEAFQGVGYRPYDISRHVPPNQGCDLSQKSTDPSINPSLFVFPYDWRQDNNQTANKLKEYIQCVQQFYSPETKIDVVAHSMGGLVVRRYILQSQQRNESHGLGKIITIASPLLGAPEAIYKIYTGGSWEFPASYVVISPTAIKVLAPNLPSMHQLLPSRFYHQFYGGLLTESGDVNANGVPDENYSFSQITSKLDSDFPSTAPGTVGAGFHDFSGQDDWRNDQSGIQYYHIVAEQNQLNTTVGLSIKNSIFCRYVGNTTLTNCHEGILYTPKKGFGDKTVPTMSASRSSGSTYLGTPNSKWFLHRSASATGLDEEKAEHTGITQNSKTHQLLARLLSDEELRPSITTPSLRTEFSANTKNISGSNFETNSSTNEADFIEYDGGNFPPAPDLANYSPAYYLTIAGTTEVIVRDESGNTALIENGLLNNQVAGLSNYEIIGDKNIMLTLSIGHTYSIEFRANDTPIGVDFVKGKGNFQPSLATRYNDLNISVNSKVKLTISQTDTVELKYDANNDGEFEVTVSPTVNVSGEAAGDVTPPTANIEVVRQGNTATATVTTQDAQSGVSRVWYSLDGENFQIYTSPLTLQYTTNPILIKAFADDAVSNRSGLYSKTFIFPPIINPTVSITAPASGAVYPVGTSVNFAGNFSNDQCDTHMAVWNFDNISRAGTINESTRAVTTSYAFTSAGVYLVSLTVNSSCGGTGSTNLIGDLTAMVVIYDPEGGFVTGGGWINSPIGAYTPNPNLVGKASFGFTSKYQPGATIPTGNTEFQFRVADFNFKSTSYDWLVVAGARAQFKGSGTINNAGNYGFMLTAIDGQVNGGGGTDKFRIKIWDKATGSIIYDNQLGGGDNENPTTVIGGGSIIIHRQ